MIAYLPLLLDVCCDTGCARLRQKSRRVSATLARISYIPGPVRRVRARSPTVHIRLSAACTGAIDSIIGKWRLLAVFPRREAPSDDISAE